jgi:uncharacterized protein YfiM (DUF2279 family)
MRKIPGTMTKSIFFCLTVVLLAGILATPARALEIDLGLEHDDINRDFWFARDKGFHWGASALITVSSYSVYHLMVKTGRTESTMLASTVTFTIGLAKEDFDKNAKKSFFSYKDLTADAAGIVTGLLIVGACHQLF